MDLAQFNDITAVSVSKNIPRYTEDEENSIVAVMTNKMQAMNIMENKNMDYIDDDVSQVTNVVTDQQSSGYYVQQAIHDLTRVQRTAPKAGYAMVFTINHDTRLLHVSFKFYQTNKKTSTKYDVPPEHMEKIITELDVICKSCYDYAMRIIDGKSKSKKK